MRCIYLGLRELDAKKKKTHKPHFAKELGQWLDSVQDCARSSSR